MTNYKILYLRYLSKYKFFAAALVDPEQKNLSPEKPIKNPTPGVFVVYQLPPPPPPKPPPEKPPPPKPDPPEPALDG